MLTLFELENGIKVAGYQMPTTKSVYLQIVVKGGAALDKLGKSGTAHLMEHMLLQGIPSLKNAEIFSEYIESRAGYVNAYTSFETVEFVLKMPYKYLEDALKIAAEVFFEPLFPEAALEKERQVMLEELYADWGSTHDKIGKYFLEAKYVADSDLKKLVGGIPEDVKNLTMEDLKTYYREVFATNNTSLAVVGNFDQTEFINLTNKYFNKYSANPDFKPAKPYSFDDYNSQILSSRQDSDLSSVYVDLSFKSLKREEPVMDWLANLMLMNIFANLHKSRLYNLLRYQEGLVYSIGMSAVSLYGFGMCNIPFECSRKNLLKILELIIDQLIAFKQNGMTESEFCYIRDYSVDDLMMQYDSPGKIIGDLVQNLLWEDKFYTAEDNIEMIKALRLDEINNVMNKYWDFAVANLSIQAAEVLTEEETVRLNQMMEKLRKC